MGVSLLLGCLLIGYSVPAALFVLMIMRKAQLVIVMLASAFFWLLALTISSLIWTAIPPLRNSSSSWALVPVGVLVVEALRGAFIRLYFRSERSFAVVSINAIVFPLIDLYSSIAAGVGFGAAHSFMFYAPVLGWSLGPGMLTSALCPSFNSFWVAAWNAFFFNVMHVLWMIVAFDAYRSMHPVKIGVVVALHAAAGGFTILNNLQDGCRMSLPLLAAVTALSAIAAIFITHRADYRSKKGRRVHSA